MTGVSIVVCCYNSANRIFATLTHLLAQERGNIELEVVIVDNASTDKTVEVCETFVDKFVERQIQFRIVSELNPGLTNARRKGLMEARHEIVIFCDDDNWLADSYVVKAHNLFSTMLNVAIAGGRIKAETEGSAPSWFDKFAMYYSVGDRYPNSGDVTANGAVLGAGMITRKSIWVKLYNKGYDFLCVDRLGGKLTSGGDIEMCLIAKLLGKNIYYSSDLFLKHFIPKERLTLNYLKRNAFGVGMFYSTALPYSYCFDKKEITRMSWLKDVVYVVVYLIRDLFSDILKWRLIEAPVNFNRNLGKLYALILQRREFETNISRIRVWFGKPNSKQYDNAG